MSAYSAMYHTDVVSARLSLIHLAQSVSEANCAISVGMARIDEAKIDRMTPDMLIFSGR